MYEKSHLGQETDISNNGHVLDSYIADLSMIDTSEISKSVEYINFLDLETEYRQTHDHDSEAEKCGLISLSGGQINNGHTGYNTTHPFHDVRHNPDTGKPDLIIGVRLERRDDELNSMIGFFKADTPFSKHWDHVDDLPNIPGQDPSAAWIDGHLFISVVEVTSSPQSKEGLTWKTAFYRSSDSGELELFAYGPPMMKDIRIAQLPTDEILVFTRPQNENTAKGGRGQIGVLITDSIETIKNPDILQDAPLIDTRFLPEEWGGINYALALNNGKVGVIGHIARYDNDHPEYVGKDNKPKIYSPFSGTFDPLKNKIQDIEILAMADEFNGVIPKKDVLREVAFGTGITDPNEDGEVMLLMGIGDAVTGYKMIKDPFAGYRFL